MTTPDPTRTLTLDKPTAWLVWDCLTAPLAGFGGRSETAAPWHAEHLLHKLNPLLLRFEPPDPHPQVELELTEGELWAINYNVPRTASQYALPLLLAVARALDALGYDLPLLPEEPPRNAGVAFRAAQWRANPSLADGATGTEPPPGVDGTEP